MNKTKILYLISSFIKSGMTIQLLNLASNLDRDNFEVIVVALTPCKGDSLEVEFNKIGIKSFCLGLNRITGFVAIFIRLMKLFKCLKPDIIHTHGFRVDAYAYLISLLIGNYKWFSTIHNYATEDYPSTYGSLFGILIAKLHWFVLKHCKYAISCSKKLSVRLMEIGINNIAIENGIDILKFTPDPQKYDLCNLQRPLFIVSGNLTENKNNMFLIEFFNKYFKTREGTCIFLGDGPEFDFVKSRITSDRIKTLGRVKDPENYLKQGDIIMSASKSEGLPNSIIEGLCCGLIALVSNIPGHYEIYNLCSDNVFLYNFNYKSFECMLNKALQRMKETDRQYISISASQNFSSKIMAKKYSHKYLESLYE